MGQWSVVAGTDQKSENPWADRFCLALSSAVASMTMAYKTPEHMSSGMKPADIIVKLVKHPISV